MFGMPDEELVSIKVTARTARFLERTAPMLRIDVPQLVDMACGVFAKEVQKEVSEARLSAQDYLKVQ